ncbi:putative late blight resistance protein homolog R1A-10 [Salvia hispanica]|uniref:putative late blight resistance protein homolog R1A-10 n=1 Tax=Salvia hispanica TaxID=49212 RepID=UPI00200908CB|nr:putative late blight resistance protein homolog R1A-10 [Salvia hispanica]
MAAYAALVSLMQIFHQIKHHPSPPISMDKTQVESITEIVVFLQEFLEGYKSPFADSDEADSLEMRITDAVYAAEDAIESNIIDQILLAASAVKRDRFFLASRAIGHEIDGLKIRPADLYESLMKVIEDLGLIKKKVMEMVAVKDQLQRQVSSSASSSNNSSSSSLFRLNSTTMVGCDDLMLQLMDKLTDGQRGRQVITIVGMGGIGKTTLSIEAWEKLQCYFPDNNNGSRIMVTTRLSNLGSQLDNYDGLKMKFLDEGSSWNLFCKIEGKSCPSGLEKIGKNIVYSCRGLPLSIVVMGGLLGKQEQTKKCWESIKGNINSLVNLEDDNRCLKILKLSCNHLPVYLKLCFLYMGAYEEDYRIRISRIIKLWVSEGFLKPTRGKSLETIAKDYLDELVERNLILVHDLGKTGNMKSLKMHDLLRDLCLREAEKERFYHVVGKHRPQGICSQRRVIISRSASEEIVVHAMKSSPHARSYISDHQRVQLFPNLKLLRILKAAPIIEHKYSPAKMLNLRLLDVIHLPSSINLMWSLQTLIVPHSNEVVDIWNMPQLRHVCFWILGGLHLPDPPSDNIVIMENLQTLKGVMNFKCDETMVSRIPNIKKLGLIYDRVQSCAHDYCVHNIERLQKLESLRCNGVQVLECWMIESSSHFPCLEHLHLMYLQDLKDIPAELGEIPTLKYVNLDECNESVVKSAKRMVEEQEELQGEEQLSFKVTVRLLEDNKELQSLANPNFKVIAPKK